MKQYRLFHFGTFFTRSGIRRRGKRIGVTESVSKFDVKVVLGIDEVCDPKWIMGELVKGLDQLGWVKEHGR